MKIKYALASLLIAGSISVANAAVTSTETLTFDDIYAASGDDWDNPISTLAPTYGGLQWDNVYVLHRDYHLSSGYENGVVSPEWVAYNSYANPASFSSTTSFLFSSVYVTNAWSNGNVHFDGYLNGFLAYSMDVAATTNIATFATFNWTVDKVVFSSPNGSQAVLDNLTVAAVPEPEAYAMFLAGLGLMGAVARRRQRA